MNKGEQMSTETTRPQNISSAPVKPPLPGVEKPLVNRRIMDSGVQLLRKRQYKELWKQTCSFIDLSLPEVMNIQKNLLLEQLPLLRKSGIGQAIMGGAAPQTVAEFRRQVPLTTYKDYSAYLLKRQEDALPVQPLLWGHTSGRTGEYDFKWCPLTSGQWEEIEKLTFAAFAFCSCSQREDIKFRLHDKLLYGAAPAPYVTGLLSRYAFSRIFDFLPPLDEAEAMSFQERGKQGITQALSKGLDFYSALPSVLVNVAERMGQGGGKKDIKALLRNPGLAARIMKGVLKSKLAHRPMLPKDVWTLKGLISAGSDGSVYKEKIRQMWGRTPMDMYACTEGLVISLQTWDYEGLCFYPSLNFFEFIPEEDVLKSKLDSTFKPRTFLLDEVEPGQNYQLAITNFHGGPFMRYVVGDMIRITARRNDRLNIDIPQMVYHSRVDDMIDIAGFTRLTESVIWKALEQSRIAYEDWTARKELKTKPILHLYIEPKGKDGQTPEYYAGLIHEQLKILDKPYSELESYLGLKPLEVTLVPSGAFNRYMLNQLQAGVELGRMKVSHLNPPDKVIDFLVNYRNK
jgi:hypothetical protein